jgi:hypothetical protein
MILTSFLHFARITPNQHSVLFLAWLHFLPPTSSHFSQIKPVFGSFSPLHIRQLLPPGWRILNVFKHSQISPSA